MASTISSGCFGYRFFKNQQWKVTNYALLIDAVLVGISFKLALNTRLERLLLLTFAWFINLLASWVLLKLENAIQRARCRLKQALDKLMIQDKKPPRNEKYLVLWVLLAVLFLAAIVSSLIIYYPSKFKATASQREDRKPTRSSLTSQPPP